jgi:hypothetical protein
MNGQNRKRSRWASRGGLALAVLAAGLACNTVTSLPILAGSAPPAATEAPEAAVPVEPTAPPNNGEQPLKLEGGPTVGTRRETRLAVTDRLPVLEILAQEDYATDDLLEVGRTFPFTIDLEQSEPLLWVYGWCATTPDIMAQNLEVMQIEYSVNGTPVDAGQFEAYGDQTGDACSYFAAVVYDWPSGTTTLQTKVVFTEALNDGFADYQPGEQLFVYTVNVP